MTENKSAKRKDKTPRTPYWRIVVGKTGYFLRLVQGANGKEILRSSQVYKSKRPAVNAYDLAGSKYPLLDEVLDERGQGASA